MMLEVPCRQEGHHLREEDVPSVVPLCMCVCVCAPGWLLLAPRRWRSGERPSPERPHIRRPLAPVRAAVPRGSHRPRPSRHEPADVPGLRSVAFPSQSSPLPRRQALRVQVRGSGDRPSMVCLQTDSTYIIARLSWLVEVPVDALGARGRQSASACAAQDLQDGERVQKESVAVAETGFTAYEVNDFRELFLACGRGRGELTLQDVTKMINQITPLGDSPLQLPSGGAGRATRYRCSIWEDAPVRA